MSDLIARSRALLELDGQIGTHWPGCEFEGGYRHYGCLVRKITDALDEALAALRQKEADRLADDADIRELAEMLRTTTKRLEAAEAQLSALRDQQPVARSQAMEEAAKVVERLRPAWGTAAMECAAAIRALVYAHPSCVSPEQQPKHPDDIQAP